MDKCPICKTQLRIKKSDMFFKNDDTPNQPTELWQYFEQTCCNNNYNGNHEKCPNFDKTVERIESRIR